jgi:hypothetical protein
MCACVSLQNAGGMPPNGHLPDSLVLSSEVIDSGGVYLLDSGADLLLYVDQEAPDQVVQVHRVLGWGSALHAGALGRCEGGGTGHQSV